MYSTPGISHSSFSMGLVTRSSTSCAEAPGICTKTSIIGTMICGSSSRGSFHTAKAPISSDRADQQRREFGGDPRLREAARGTQAALERSLPDLDPRAVLQIPRHRHDDLLARVQAGQNLHRIARCAVPW